MQLARGTVSVVDKGGQIYQRIWCGYEAYITLMESKPGYCWDVYTAGCFGGVAAGVTDGLAETDDGQVGRKKRREEPFPLALARQSLGITVETSSASVEDDRKHILNSMVGADDLDATPPQSDVRYDELNGLIRAKFAAATLRKAFTENAAGDFLRTLAGGSLGVLHLNLEDCDGFGDEEARQLAASMPTGVKECDLKLRPHMPAFAAAGGYAKLMENCTSIDLCKNDLGTNEVEALAASLSGNVSLTECNVRDNNLDATSATLLTKVAREKSIMLFGIKHGQVEADLSKQHLGLADAILIASDLSVTPSLIECNLCNNSLGVEGWTIIFNALRNSPTSKITTWDLSNESIGPEIAKPLAEYISVTTSVTSVWTPAHQP